MLENGVFLAVRFENGLYFRHSLFSSERETDDLNDVAKYGFDWQPAKDLYLQMYVGETNKKYELVKVRTHYTIINE